MSLPRLRSPDSLTTVCKTFIIKYTHQVLWRQIDPPGEKCHDCFKPTDFDLLCPLPSKKSQCQKDSQVFRKEFRELKLFFSRNLVRSVYDELTRDCSTFVFENRLKYGDVLLSLVFLDPFSKTLEMNAKHLVFKHWSLREEMSLQRTLQSSTNLVKLSLPGKASEKLLILLSKYCQLLEDLDISTSYITDIGLLALCGVEVKTEEISSTTKEDDAAEMSTSQGWDAMQSGSRSRLSAIKARERLEKIKSDPSFVRKLAIGCQRSRELRDDLSLMASKMKPYIEKKLDPSLQTSWSSMDENYSCFYSFTNHGCKNLVRLDLTRTNYPKRSLDSKGKMIVTLGITRDSVLAALILLEKLAVLKWIDLGESLQLYEMIFKEVCSNAPKLDLQTFMDSSLSIDKLDVAKRICPKINALDISMFNFSFAEENFHADALDRRGNGEQTQEECLYRANATIFSFDSLTNLEIQYMDDSPTFRSFISNGYGKQLTRLCLNKMISLSFETLSTIKRICTRLNTLEIFVDNIYSIVNAQPIDQVIAEAENTTWNSLKSLKIGGSISSVNIIKYLISGCSFIKLLCLSPYDLQAHLITDQLVSDILSINPCTHLVAFYFEKCSLSDQSFFLLIENLPCLKNIGIITEWFGVDRRSRLGIKAYVKGNNLDVNVDSVPMHDI